MVQRTLGASFICSPFLKEYNERHNENGHNFDENSMKRDILVTELFSFILFRILRICQYRQLVRQCQQECDTFQHVRKRIRLVPRISLYL